MNYALGDIHVAASSGFNKIPDYPFVAGELNSRDIDYVWALCNHYDCNFNYLKIRDPQHQGYDRSKNPEVDENQAAYSPIVKAAMMVLFDIQILLARVLKNTDPAWTGNTPLNDPHFLYPIYKDNLFASAYKRANNRPCPSEEVLVQTRPFSMYDPDTNRINVAPFWYLVKSHQTLEPVRGLRVTPYVPGVAGTGVPPFIVGSVLQPTIDDLDSLYTVATSTTGTEYGELPPEQVFTQTQYTVPNIQKVYNIGIPVLETLPVVNAGNFFDLNSSLTSTTEKKSNLLKIAAIGALAVGGIYLATR
jgi:hypothetical protein